MASLGGILHRPISTAAAVAVATVSSDLPDRFVHPRSFDTSGETPQSNMLSDCSEQSDSWVSRISLSNISNLPLASSFQKHTTGVKHSQSRQRPAFMPSCLFNSIFLSISSVPVLHTLYLYAKIGTPSQSKEYASIPSSPSDVLYKWHLPDLHSISIAGNSSCGTLRSQTVVVLLGWLGARQKHLKRYADWYTSRGFHVITFTFPMEDVLSYKVGGKVEQNLELLANHLSGWIAEEHDKNLVFHTFSNTGWLIYGAILEKFQIQDLSLVERIKGCIVDSAPVAAPDPQVWALGFSTAFLKKRSVGTKGSLNLDSSKRGASVENVEAMESKPAATEIALLAVLEKLFEVVLNLPSINRRLSDILDVLLREQPKCPQLYIYSSSDRVIPAKSVESFVEKQRRAGHVVRACDFGSSPHVDHFRSHPNLYTSQLTRFLEDLVFTPATRIPTSK